MTKQKSRGMLQSDREAIVGRYRAGETLEEIAGDYDTRAANVGYLLRTLIEKQDPIVEGLVLRRGRRPKETAEQAKTATSPAKAADLAALQKGREAGESKIRSTKGAQKEAPRGSTKAASSAKAEQDADLLALVETEKPISPETPEQPEAQRSDRGAKTEGDRKSTKAAFSQATFSHSVKARTRNPNKEQSGREDSMLDTDRQETTKDEMRGGSGSQAVLSARGRSGDSSVEARPRADAGEMDRLSDYRHLKNKQFGSGQKLVDAAVALAIDYQKWRLSGDDVVVESMNEKLSKLRDEMNAIELDTLR